MNSKPNFPSEIHWSIHYLKLYMPVLIVLFPSGISVAGYPEKEANKTTLRPFICRLSLTFLVSLKFMCSLCQNFFNSFYFVTGKTLQELNINIVIVF
jgi:hypothetical protein